jgi:hypothetical protein
MNSYKVVIPAPAEIQDVCKALEKLDSRFHGNDRSAPCQAFYEIVNYFKPCFSIR